MRKKRGRQDPGHEEAQKAQKGMEKGQKGSFRCQGTDSIHRRTAETLSRLAKYYADMLENPSKTTVFSSTSAQSVGLHKLTENREAGKPALAIECLCAHD